MLESMSMDYPSFPAGFLWGAATSAHQVEGGNDNDWTEWEKLGRVARGERSGAAADHYRRFYDDIALAAQLGHNTYRFSIEWSRVEPEEGKWNAEAVDHYRNAVAELRRHDIEPMVTLHHFTNPVWIARQGGWASRKTVGAFCRYVERIADMFGGDVRYWITINEPTVYALLGYLKGYWPPEQKNIWRTISVLKNLSRAHARAHDILHRRRAGVMVGAANNLVDFVPDRPTHLLDRLMTAIAWRFYNDWWLKRTVKKQDFIGLNYYFHHPLRFRWASLSTMFAPTVKGGFQKSDLGWPVVPAGFGRVLRRLKDYRKPVIITENGLADGEDTRRADFIRNHVAEMKKTMDDGVDVRGYLHWSLLDNFEWREGFAPRFGLVAVDYQTQKRTVRPSAYVFRDMLRAVK